MPNVANRKALLALIQRAADEAIAAAQVAERTALLDLPPDCLAQLAHCVYRHQYLRGLDALLRSHRAFRAVGSQWLDEVRRAASEPLHKFSKVVVIGDSGVGKTSFVQRHVHIPEDWPPRHMWSLPNHIWPTITFGTEHGRVSFEVWEPAGKSQWSAPRDGFYMGASAAIIMFDIGSRISYKNIPNWHRDVRRVCGEDVPIVIIGSKVDLPSVLHAGEGEPWAKLKPKFITFPIKKCLPYFEISALANHGIDAPFLWLARKLWRRDLHFLGGCATSLPGGCPKPAELQVRPSALHDRALMWRKVREATGADPYTYTYPPYD